VQQVNCFIDYLILILQLHLQ